MAREVRRKLLKLLSESTSMFVKQAESPKFSVNFPIGEELGTEIGSIRTEGRQPCFSIVTQSWGSRAHYSIPALSLRARLLVRLLKPSALSGASSFDVWAVMYLGGQNETSHSQ